MRNVKMTSVIKMKKIVGALKDVILIILKMAYAIPNVTIPNVIGIVDLMEEIATVPKIATIFKSMMVCAIQNVRMMHVFRMVKTVGALQAAIQILY